MFANYTTPATRKTLSAYSGDKTSYGAVSGTIYGAFNPIAPNQNTIALGIVSQAYEFVTGGDETILAGDTLTINSIEYGVKGVALYEQMSISVLKCVLEKTIQN